VSCPAAGHLTTHKGVLLFFGTPTGAKKGVLLFSEDRQRQKSTNPHQEIVIGETCATDRNITPQLVLRASFYAKASPTAALWDFFCSLISKLGVS
jgi:hypothetical protein